MMRLIALIALIAGVALAAACGSDAGETTARSAAETQGATGKGALAADEEDSEDQAGAANVDTATVNWVVDKARSWVSFTGIQTGKEFTGRFSTYDAMIDFDPDNLSTAKIEVGIDMSSAKTGDKQRDDALPSKDWFSASSFPMARFSASDVASTGSGVFEARGKLTIRDVTRDLTLPFRLSIDGSRATADGAVTLVRTDFGVGQGEFATGEWVGLEVLVSFHIEATR
jgi:polyisoprenoid-binding protein YceI